MCDLPACEHIAPDITDYPADPQTPTDVTVTNWDDMPLGIEASLAPVGCVYDVNGNLVGKVFISKVTDEETQTETNVLQYLDRTTGTIVPYDVGTHGQWSECQKQDLALEQDAIVANWLPICVDGVQWYAREREVIDNTNGSSTSVVIEYKQGVDGAITTTAPTGTITDGYCQANSALVKTYDWELTCLTNDGGATVEQGVVAFDMSDPQDPTETLYLNGVDVTGTYTRTDCTQATQDRELVTNCYQDITDPTIRYQRVDVIDVASTPATVLETIWLDSTGAVITEPSNIQLCGDIPSRQALPHQVGCIVTEGSCQVVNRTEIIAGTDFVSFRILSNDNNGNFTVVQTMASLASKDALLQVFTDLASAGTRTKETIVGSGDYYFWDGNFDNVTDISVGTTYEVQYNYHVETGVTDAPNPHLSDPCVEPYADSDYQNTAGILGGYYDSVPLDTNIPYSEANPINFEIDTYTVIPGSSVQVKQFVWEELDGSLTEEYRLLGDVATIVPFDYTTQVFVPNCLEDTGGTTVDLPLTECTGGSTEQIITVAPPTYNFQPITEMLGADNVYNFEDFAQSNTNGLVVDGVTDDLVAPDGRTIYLNMTSGGDTITRIYDTNGNVYVLPTPVGWDYSTDPTGSTFISAISAEIDNAISAFGLTPAFATYGIAQNVSPTLLGIQLDIFGTDGQTQPAYLDYVYFSNTTVTYFNNLNVEFEADYNFDGSLVTSDPTSLTFKVTASVPTGQQAIFGVYVNGIFGEAPAPYQIITGNGTLTEYTVSLPVSGNDIMSGAYTITQADMQSGNVFAWFYSENPNTPGDVVRLDGAVMEVGVIGEVVAITAMLTKGCNDDRRDDLLQDIVDGLGSTSGLTTGSTFEYVYGGGIYTPSYPANVKEVVVTNESDAIIEVYTNHGSFAVPPHGTSEFSVDDSETSIQIQYVVNFGGGQPYNGEFIIFNYRTRS